MTRTRIKICGITNPQDAADAVAAGVDALGFVFHAGSSRFVEPLAAATIAADLPAFVTTVALCVDESHQSLAALLEVFPADLVQFHGSETPAFCEAAGVAYIRAIPVTNQAEVSMQARKYPGAQSIMLDTSHEGQFGGTGRVFDWSQVPDLEKPLIVAGGLNTENVHEAVSRLRPYAVDVSGAVEVTRGIKDAAKMKAFVAAVQAADRELI